MGFKIKKGVLNEYTEESDVTEVIIPESVTEIGDSAFEDCTNLTSVTIPESVTKIGIEAFSGCTSLTSVTIPDSVTEIGGCAFSDCTSLASVTIPDSVTKIGVSAFSGCASLTSVTIPEGVTEINGCFFGCTSLASVMIPKSVTMIGSFTFNGCKSLTSVTIPEDVTEIEESAFFGCESLTSVTIPEGMTKIGEGAFEYCKGLTSVTIPEGVTKIGKSAFYGCTNLTSVTLPDSVTEIGSCAFNDSTALNRRHDKTARSYQDNTDGFLIVGEKLIRYQGNGSVVMIPDSVKRIEACAFKDCRSLSSVTIPDSVNKIDEFAFEGCTKQVVEFAHGISHLTDDALKEFVIPNWKIIKPDAIAELFITKHSWPMLELYSAFRGKELNTVGKEILTLLGDEPSAELCNAAGDFITMFYADVDADILKSLYEVISSSKSGKKAVWAIEDKMLVRKKLGIITFEDEDRGPVEEKILSKISEDELFKKLKRFYKLEPEDLPKLKGTNRKELSPIVLAYLMTVHESFTHDIVYAKYKKSGICPEAADVLKDVTKKSVQDAMQSLVSIGNIGYSSYDEKNMLSFPICRYADEAIMQKLSSDCWLYGSDKYDPAWDTFKDACLYSECECVMELCDRINALERYAKIRGTDAETLRDTALTAVDLDDNGCHTFDLGDRIVTARLTSECTLGFEASDGEVSESFPEKGSDEKKYKKAKAEFSKLKTNVDKVFRRRFELILSGFRSGSGKEAKRWFAAYTGNIALRKLAKLIVWQQGDRTFTLTDNGLIDSNGNEYILTADPVIVAHPMEMQADDLERWQKYFYTKGLKQPFEQVWEPVRDPDEEIKEDRYAGCIIPYRCFGSMKEHGIYTGWEEGSPTFRFDGLDVEKCYMDFRVDRRLNMNYRVELSKISFDKYTRQTNHIIAYLDKLTALNRVENDDVSVVQLLPGFTPAQICDFITAAQKAKAVNVLKKLLEYKNNTFPDYDLAERFTLGW